MPQTEHDDLDALMRLGEREVASAPDRYPFLEIGLILQTPPTRWTYDSTPINSVTFATTGGDGVHFGLLHSGDVEPDCFPVVMTVPMSFDRPNVVVGANLREFLALGCRSGYSILEELAYDLDAGAVEVEATVAGVVDDPSKFAASWAEAELRQLQLIRETFGVSPWGAVRQRIGYLQQQFLRRIEPGTEGVEAPAT